MLKFELPQRLWRDLAMTDRSFANLCNNCLKYWHSADPEAGLVPSTCCGTLPDSSEHDRGSGRRDDEWGGGEPLQDD